MSFRRQAVLLMGQMAEEHGYAASLRDRYGYDQIETLGAEAFRALVAEHADAERTDVLRREHRRW